MIINNDNTASPSEGTEQEALLWLQEALYGGGQEEDVWDWIKGIGTGAASGALTGSAGGGWGALIGGLLGAGLGAVQTAIQQQGTTSPRPSSLATPPPSVPPKPTKPQPPSQSINPQLVTQLTQLMPQLIQLLSQRRAGEASEEQEGDLVPDEAFMTDDESNASLSDVGIDEPIPEVWEQLAENALTEYPQATRFVPAHTDNYRLWSQGGSPRPIRRIVIHITDGSSPNIGGVIGWFQDARAGVSAHYIVGRDGDVVQMVRHNDVAYHAHSANADSIGIEHVANARGLNPTEAQYCSSAALVNWLCKQYSIPMDRHHILGHSEADAVTTHRGCPNDVWNWDYYMQIVTSGSCSPQPSGQSEVETVLDADDTPEESMQAHQWQPTEVAIEFPSEWITTVAINDLTPKLHWLT